MKTVEDLEATLKELEDANKIKTNFISNISHEIKTPLNAIMGFSDILREAYQSEVRGLSPFNSRIWYGVKSNS